MYLSVVCLRFIYFRIQNVVRIVDSRHILFNNNFNGLLFQQANVKIEIYICNRHVYKLQDVKSIHVKQGD